MIAVVDERIEAGISDVADGILQAVEREPSVRALKSELQETQRRIGKYDSLKRYLTIVRCVNERDFERRERANGRPCLLYTSIFKYHVTVSF